ncbi:MAG TPA: response regulator [Candidatus Xenobia bacterium]|jgi:CheY-like chemotaxis protein
MPTVLIIDDSAFSRRVLRSHLEAGGYRVVEASDGLAGLERYSLERPDAVTLDLTMTGIHGLEVLEQLRQLDPHVRVLIATADIQSATREMSSLGGAAGYIQKPFSTEDVVARVGAVLRGEEAW